MPGPGSYESLFLKSNNHTKPVCNFFKITIPAPAGILFKSWYPPNTDKTSQGLGNSYQFRYNVAESLPSTNYIRYQPLVKYRYLATYPWLAWSSQWAITWYMTNFQRSGSCVFLDTSDYLKFRCTSGVIMHWYSPFWDPEITKGLGFNPSGVQVKLLLALCWQWALTWGCRLLVRSGLLLCFERKKFSRCNEEILHISL
jgi:hypothetical protein